MTNAKNDVAAKYVKTAERTHASIKAHIGRGGTPNGQRGQTLYLRYDDAETWLKQNDYPAWKAYCKRLELDPSHNAFDCFA